MRMVAGIVGLWQAANGAVMIAAPVTWYRAVPGVSAAGPFNYHFIVDVGLAHLAAGLGLTLAAARHARSAAIAAAAWPALHALFHLYLWTIHGPPKGGAFMAEGLGVVAVSFLGLFAASRVRT